MLSNEFSQGLLLVVSQKAKQESKSDTELVRRDFSAQLQPLSGRQLDFHAHDLADINSPCGVYKTTSKAQVFNAAFVIAGQASPLRGEVSCNSFVAASVFSHSNSFLSRKRAFVIGVNHYELTVSVTSSISEALSAAR